MVDQQRWRVWYTRRGLPGPVTALPFVGALLDGLDGWLDEGGIAEGTPFLVSPLFEYDVDLNGFYDLGNDTALSILAFRRDLADVPA